MSAFNKVTRFAYTPRGELWRTWGDVPYPVEYSGELAQVDYSDATPDVTFVYDRLGRSKQVSDGSGAHVMAYHPSSLDLASETRTGLVPAVLTHKESTSGVVGRRTGVQLDTGYDVTYGYDAQGHMATAGWNVSDQSDTATYTRVLMNRLTTGVVMVSLFSLSCDKGTKISHPTWKDVVAGTSGLGDATAMEGRVLFYEERHGLRDQQCLIKVAVSKERFDSLLRQWSLDPEMKECTSQDFRKSSSDPAWVLPNDTTMVPCTIGKIKVRGVDAWVATAYVLEQESARTQTVFLNLVAPLYD